MVVVDGDGWIEDVLGAEVKSIHVYPPAPYLADPGT